MAWGFYHQSRLEGVGDVILELRRHEIDELAPYEREQLAHKLEVIGSTYAEIERDDMKAARDKAEIERRKRGRA